LWCAEHDLADGDIAVIGTVTALFAVEGGEELIRFGIINRIEIAYLATGFTGDDQGLGGSSGLRIRTNLLELSPALLASQ